MIVRLLVALGLACVTVVMHALGTLTVVAYLARVRRRKRHNPGWLAAEIQIARVVCTLLLLHVAEATVWAGVYQLLDLLPDFPTATYFSLTSYTTVGYGDVVLPAPWRLLGPFEGAVGILMFGWSTGVMVAVISGAYGERLRVDPPAPQEPSPAASPRGGEGRQPV